MTIRNQNRNVVLILFTGIAALAILVAMIGALFASNYEVVDKGEGMLPYTKGYIYDVRFFDQFNLYIEREKKKPSDIIGGIILSGTSFIALTFAFLILLFSNTRAGDRLLLMFVALSAGTLFLAADELFGIHENIGHNLRFLANLPLVKRPDDFIIALYLIPALLFLFYFRRELLASRAALAAFATGIAIFCVALIAEFVDASRLEEFLEALATFSVIPGTFLLGVAHLGRVLDR